MSRNGSGVYSLPGTYAAVSGETIEAQQHNDPLEDLQTDANTARPVVAGGTGATTATDARTNLGLGDAATHAASDFATAGFDSGDIKLTARSSAPTGWLLCDGSAVSRTTYADLFTAISTTYGTGDGSTTFNVPDLCGRVAVGKEATSTRLTSAVGGVDGQTLGATGGAQSKTIAQANLPSVNFAVSIPSGQGSHLHTGGVGLYTGAQDSGGSAASGGTASTGAATLPSMTGTAASGGSGTALPVVQPTIVLNYIIKT